MWKLHPGGGLSALGTSPEMTARVLDWAIQLFGAAGVSQVFPLAYLSATARTMRILDGPDEVHRRQIAQLELRKYEAD